MAKTRQASGRHRPTKVDAMVRWNKPSKRLRR